MTVEPLSEKYYPDIVRLVENFHNEAVSEYDDLFDAKVLIETMKNADVNSAFLLVVDGVCQGILFGIHVPSYTNDRIIFQEVIWYVNKPFRRYGINLLKEVENILKSRGVSIMIMAVLENSKTEKLKRFYESMGYKKMETHFVRSL